MHICWVSLTSYLRALCIVRECDAMAEERRTCMCVHDGAQYNRHRDSPCKTKYQHTDACVGVYVRACKMYHMCMHGSR
jgi:hypothetical protein